MALDFPSSPTVGQASNGYTWDGEKWLLSASAGGASVTVSDTPPSSPAANSLWWESDTGILYIYYNDGSSSQWVAVAGGGGSADLSTTVRMVGTDNMIGGRAAGAALTTGLQNVVIGAEAGKTLTGDTGHTLVGYMAGSALNSNAATWNTFLGHVAGRFAVSSQSSVAIGRASMAYDTDGHYITAVGHASYFTGLHSVGVTAVGDTAAGAPVDGSGTNWNGSGLTYYGSISDVSCSYIGRFTGKSSAAGRTNAHAIGTMARIPARDNVMVLGHGLGAVTAAARVFDGWTRSDVSQNAAMTLLAANIIAGLLIRSGSPSGAVTDVTDTAANLVAQGPGHNCELPCSFEFSFGNQTNFTVTVSGGAGVTVSGLGLGGAVASASLAKFRIVYSNVTPGAEACVLYRVG